MTPAPATSVPLLPASELAALVEAEPAGLGRLDTERGSLPLAAVDLDVEVHGLHAVLVVRQRFVNHHQQPLEATYTFPLPERAAVGGFEAVVGGRRLVASLEERAAARARYDEAVAAGQRAAIAEEERPSTFTLRVGNIPPGAEAETVLTLDLELSVDDGEVTLRAPLVVAPRYTAGSPLPGPSVGGGVSPDTDAVPDASLVTPPTLEPGAARPALTVRVRIEPAGLVLSGLRSALHAVRTADADGAWLVEAAPGARLDRDVVLRWKVAGHAPAVSAVGARGDDGSGVVGVTVTPPTPDAGLPGRPGGRREPVDLVVLLDRSGSMAGWKMVTARRAAARLVELLAPGDRFAALAFDNSVERPDSLPAAGLTAATDQHRCRAVEFFARTEARGGTELAAALANALDQFGADPAGGRRRVVVVVTDAEVAGEDHVLAAMAPRLVDAQLYCLGVDVAADTGLLWRLAQAGGGHAEVVESADRLDEVMSRFGRRLVAPDVTGLALTGDGVELVEISPARAPDLASGHAVTFYARVERAADGAGIVVEGALPDGGRWRAPAVLSWSEGPALRRAWARHRLRDLEDRYAAGIGDGEALAAEIVRLSLAEGVLCRFTAFVALDPERERVEGPLTRVVQPVEPPAGWAASPAAAAPAGIRPLAARFQAPLTLGSSAPPDAFAAPSRRAAPEGAGSPLGEAVERLLEEIERILFGPHADLARAARLLTVLVGLLEDEAVPAHHRPNGGLSGLAAAVRLRTLVEQGAAEAEQRAALAELRAALTGQPPASETGRRRRSFWR
ncbi:MAG: VIT domain-containing protein [Acidimicrobiales bacterium]